MQFSLRFVSLVCGLLMAPTVWSAPPAVTGLFPSGVQVGQSAKVTLRGTVGDPAPQIWFSRPGITLTPGEKPAEWTLAAAADTPPGVAWLRFHNPEGATDLRAIYVGTLPEIAETEPNNTNPQAQKIATLPVLVNGVLHKGGELDSFAVTLEAGQLFTASLEAHRSLGSPMDGVLQAVGPDGFVFAQNDDDREFDPQLTFTAPRPGTYTIRVFAFPSDPNSTINYAGAETYIYRLTLAAGPVADHVLPLAIAASATPPAPLQLHFAGVPTDPVSLVPILLDGEAFLPTTGPTSFLAHRLPIVTIPLALEATPADPAQPQALALPCCLTGHVAAPGEVDTYRFTGEKGKTVRFSVEARRFDSPLDPLLRLRGPDGKVLKEQDDEGRKSLDIEMGYTLPADGEYRFEITDRFRAGGPRYAYLLTVDIPGPDFRLTTDANHWTLKNGTPLEIPVAIERQSAFAEEIQITVEGLPADSGITVAETKSAVKGETAKNVKLKLESQGTMPLSLPIRIIGTSGGTTRRADAPIAGVPDRTANLWLTAPKK